MQLIEKLCVEAPETPWFPPYRHTTLPQHFVLGTDIQAVGWLCPGLITVDPLASEEKTGLPACGIGQGHASVGERGARTPPINASLATDCPASSPFGLLALLVGLEETMLGLQQSVLQRDL